MGPRWKRLLAGAAGALMGVAATSAASPAMPPLPPLSAQGLAEYREYLEAPDHRAFAVAPGGAWGWVSAQASAAAAREGALAVCQKHTPQRCLPYALDNRVVHDAAAWAGLWAPYATAGQARKASAGRDLGQRMVDLAFADDRGKRASVAALKGKVAVLHFWGSWCGPCRKEMPELERLRAALADRRDVAFVLLQAREPFAAARRWAEAQQIRLPLHDSGATGEDDDHFRLASGRRIPDREIASRFPTTYVLDKHGLVVFSHVGPVADWPAYEPLLRDAAERSGR